MFSWLKNKYTEKMTVRLILAAAAGSMLYGLIRRPFLRYFIDGITLSSAVLILAGCIMNKSFGAGYSFMLARKQTGRKISELMKERYEREAEKNNPPLFAGLFLLVLTLVLLLIYYI